MDRGLYAPTHHAVKNDGRQVRPEPIFTAPMLGRCRRPKQNPLILTIDRDQDADARNSARRRAYPPIRVSRRVRVPEHDPVEIDRLRFRTPVTVDAEARLCVDEGRAVAADAVVTIRHGSLVAAAPRSVEPNVGLATGVMGGIEAHVHRGPTLPRQVALADMRAPYRRCSGARCAGGHLREETHALAERPRLDLEEGAGVARLPNLERILLDLVDDRPAGLPSRNRNVPRPV